MRIQRSLAILVALALLLFIGLSIKMSSIFRKTSVIAASSLASLSFNLHGKLTSEQHIAAPQNHITSFIAHAQDLDTSIFAGKYKDPFHPGCLRQISSKDADITIVGSDNPDGSKRWTLLAKEKNAGQILVDFSPKGGPKDLLGVYSAKLDGIQWPDGNVWTKLSKK